MLKKIDYTTILLKAFTSGNNTATFLYFISTSTCHKECGCSCNLKLLRFCNFVHFIFTHYPYMIKNIKQFNKPYITQTVPCHEECGCGWHFDPYAMRCFKLHSGVSINWEEAVRRCTEEEDAGSNLASITGPTEQQYINGERG